MVFLRLIYTQLLQSTYHQKCKYQLPLQCPSSKKPPKWPEYLRRDDSTIYLLRALGSIKKEFFGIIETNEIYSEVSTLTGTYYLP